MSKIQRAATSRNSKLPREVEIAALATAQRRDRAHEKTARRTNRAGSRSDDEWLSAHKNSSVLPPPARVNKADAPDFDEEMGRISEGEEPTDARTLEHLERDVLEWRQLAGEVLARLKPLYAQSEVELKVLQRGERSGIAEIIVSASRELQLLHRALLPGWRALLTNWFKQWAMAKIEAKQRPLRNRLENVKGIGYTLTNRAPPRKVPNSERFLEILHRNPVELMGKIPPGLTPQILEFLRQRVNLKSGGRNGGYTPATAVQMAEKWANDDHGFEAVLKDIQVRDRKRKRRNRH